MISAVLVRTSCVFWLLAMLAPAPWAWGQDAPTRAVPQGNSASGGDPRRELAIGPGDLLGIEIVGLDELDSKVRVANDGTIRLPLVGAVDVRGLTPSQVEQSVAVALREKKLVNDAVVAVIVEEYVSQGVSVMGAVGRPGTYQVVGGKTVFDILLEAGGMRADAREIIIIRELGPGHMERILVDAVKLLVEGDLSRDVVLQAGDILMVPEATKFKIFVTGSVARQGPIEFPAGDPLTLLQAISAAGGASERAKLGSVKILRQLPDGSPEIVVVNLKRVRKGLDPDVVLQPNDSVIVGERFF